MIVLLCMCLCIVAAVLILRHVDNRKRMPTDQDVNNRLNELNRLHLERNNPHGKK